ncbi:MAG TPA: EamA family transporter [Longimicrobium sp.]|uniref:DMT family transporter n=1 Tax=Longimicrobium sp. TaxID=2029185 RepID=UPI002EDA4726
MANRTTWRLQVLGAALLFSTGGAAIKATTLTAWQVAGFRSAVAAAAVFLLVPAARRGWTWHVVPVGVAYASTLVLFVTANKLTTSANAIFLQSTAPLYMLLFGPLLLKEAVRRRDLVFMAPVVLGLLLFFVGSEAPVQTAPNPPLGNLMAVASGATWALTLVGLRWMGNRAGGDGSALPTVVAGNLIAFLACLPASLPVVDAGTGDWLAVAYLGVFQIGAAYLLLAAGIRHVPALEASVLLMLEPALNPVWAWLVHGETPGPWAITGGVLILGATLLRTAADARADRRAGADAPSATDRSEGLRPDGE